MPQQYKAGFGYRGKLPSSSYLMPKAKTASTDRVLCACGCGKTLSRCQQTRHLQACGPVMAVAKVIETRAYFHEQCTESTESSQPHKFRRLQTPMLADDSPLLPVQQAQGYTAPQDIMPQHHSPSPTPPPQSTVVLRAACKALSAPWTGPADFHYGDDDVFKNSNDAGSETTQHVPIPNPAELESSDTDEDADEDASDIRLDRSSVEIPDIFETNADLDAEEYSEHVIILLH